MSILFFCEVCGGSVEAEDAPDDYDFDRDGPICTDCKENPTSSRTVETSLEVVGWSWLRTMCSQLLQASQMTCDWCGSESTDLRYCIVLRTQSKNYGRIVEVLDWEISYLSPCCIHDINKDGVRAYELVEGIAEL